ncbi:uncharacterized protein LOC130940209 isoform X3 [Arachis stenosperma]|uniref:uncharacterized protein LOC130940209 isoform X3 n=1 Tax=Arachis stenosperma TaxID=217475 RepID=UPI0025AD17E5|nr:uncharacterized protein LOC130940209 isoform X3 [Arachis stenosperma]
MMVRLTLPKQCELSHFKHTFQYWFIMMMSVFRTSDSEGDMGFQVGDMQGTIPVTLGLSKQHSFLSFVIPCESTKRRVPCINIYGTVLNMYLDS